VTTEILMLPTSRSHHGLVAVWQIVSRATATSTFAVKDETGAKKALIFAAPLSEAEEAVSIYVVWQAVPRMLPLLIEMDAEQ
jgi:hypothetical protein